jgi:DNA polymerase (family 10)
MAFSNVEVAQAFETIATLLEIENANQFRVRAYRNAARVIEGLPQPLTDLVAKEEDLSEYSGIGEDLAGKIKDFVETGHIPLLDQLSSHHPKGIVELARLENLGPKRIKILHDELGVSSLKSLKQACEREQVREVRGFGVKTEKKLLNEIKVLSKSGVEKRLLWSQVDEIARSLVNYLNKSPEVNKVEVAGSYRRRKETVGDLDILITCNHPKKVIDYFVAYEDVKEILSRGITRSTVVLRTGLHVDLRVLKDESFGAGLYYFTGSKAHNIEVRKIARHNGLKINEYGVFKGARRIAGKTEEEVFKAVHLDYIPPELRENRGEIQAAQEHHLPDLIKREDLCGDLHSHTTATDGRNTIEEMALAAKASGLKYLAITDHSQQVHVANGLDVKRLRKHIEDIERVNAKISGITLLKGIEVDILEDGSLDLPNEILKELDIRICSIHYRFKMNKEMMTKRILKAMENPYFNVLGHPTGRLLLKREPYEFDLERIIRAAVELGKIFEIDSQPDRLDLSAEHCQMAQELGAKFVIDSDAHSISGLNYLNYGVAQARRGWIERKNVLNTLPWEKLRKILK